ncbi:MULTISPECIES: hypothetical protein [Novilysobacter]|uniref:hypothetical protein n=1 Tax=Novilysobacter TaxID=3382699 RepID=UPI002ED9D10C
MVLRIFVVLIAFYASEAYAQAKPDVEHAGATELRANMAGAGQAQERLIGKLLGRGGDYRYMMIRRDRTSQIQAHGAWDEIIVVKEGAATMLYGGQFKGGRAAGSEERGGGTGEMRGGEIIGGTNQPLGAGDLLIIPAGVAHQVHVEAGRSVTYLVIKVARAMQSPNKGL